MRSKFAIPLSYNPIDASALAQKLNEYSDRHHDEIIVDFEAQLCDITGSGFAVALNSGTSAIHLGLKSLGVGENDYVIASTFTYVATINPILYLRAIPVFVDSERSTWNMDPELLEQAILQCKKENKKPKAIIVVHTYGTPARLDRILEIATRYEIPVLEDAAEAIGSMYQQKGLGTLGEVGVLSFNNNKLLTTYGGGALLTKDKTVFEKVLYWATHSRENLPYYEHAELGFNYRMGPVNAAMGLVQLADLPFKVHKRREIFSAYRKLLDGIPGAEWQREPTHAISNRWISGLVLTANQDKIRQALFQQGIETRPLWKPMHIQPVFKSYQSFLNDTSSFLFKNGFCLPSGCQLTDEEIELVVKVVKEGN